MGFFSFIKNAGKKIGLFAEEAAEDRAEAKEAPLTPEEIEAKNAEISTRLAGSVTDLGLSIENMQVEFRGGVATVRGTTPSQAEREKIVLALGNNEGVSAVEDLLEVVSPEPPGTFYTVEKGDSLSAISKANYGVLQLYDVIFEANKPMLKDPDEIYPGQVLRIPHVSDSPTHTVSSGETLGKIAKHWYGEAGKYKDIYEANKDKLSSPDAIEVGQALVIPTSNPAPTEAAEALA